MTITPLLQLTIVRQRLAERKPVYDVYRLWKRLEQPALAAFMKRLMSRQSKEQWWTTFAQELARKGGARVQRIEPSTDWSLRLVRFIDDDRFISLLQQRLTEAEKHMIDEWLLSLEDEWTYGRYRFSFQVNERAFCCGDYRISGARLYVRRQVVARIASQYGQWETFHARARREWLYLPDDVIVARFERELKGILKKYRCCANYRALRPVVDFARNSLYATLAAKHRCTIRQLKRTMTYRVCVWCSLVDSQSASRIR